MLCGGKVSGSRMRSVSRRQVARPAVVLSVLDQMSFMPPVEAAAAEIWPEQSVSSSSMRKDSARECLRAAKSFLCARRVLVVSASVSRGFLTGDLFLLVVVGAFFFGLVGGVVYASSSLLSSRPIPSIIFTMSSRHFCFRGLTGGWLGAWVSVHSFTASGFQYASRLGLPCRCSALGITGRFLDGDTSFVGLGGKSGGVDGREIGGALHGERSFVGVGIYVSIALAPLDDEVVGREDDSKEAVRTRTCCGGSKLVCESGEFVRSTISCFELETML